MSTMCDMEIRGSVKIKESAARYLGQQTWVPTGTMRGSCQAVCVNVSGKKVTVKIKSDSSNSLGYARGVHPPEGYTEEELETLARDAVESLLRHNGYGYPKLEHHPGRIVSTHNYYSDTKQFADSAIAIIEVSVPDK